MSRKVMKKEEDPALKGLNVDKMSSNQVQEEINKIKN